MELQIAAQASTDELAQENSDLWAAHGSCRNTMKTSMPRPMYHAFSTRNKLFFPCRKISPSFVQFTNTQYGGEPAALWGQTIRDKA
jgi:hypothetical protein